MTYEEMQLSRKADAQEAIWFNHRCMLCLKAMPNTIQSVPTQHWNERDCLQIPFCLCGEVITSFQRNSYVRAWFLRQLLTFS